MKTEKYYDDMTETEEAEFWNKIAQGHVKWALTQIKDMRRESAKKLIIAIQDTFQRHDFGYIGKPVIAVYAAELALLAQLPESDYDCRAIGDDVPV